ncbi:winged helix-turn-helix domain-containing protein [Ancylobacter sp. 6x-1]|uniref:Winged helix-turn-helix domain-containing protein n=1 Tax=Ancylobacter crimeensis TaxID=2579147 RepID=A0ABT0D9I9_9HYPH|nr:winged helix-turn-helix domain-containing protein [Ancylobacter crimeensis]MCK0196613.1 winged helix-turn-helix domain-containing protein [Ancylobacter crimeensis]
MARLSIRIDLDPQGRIGPGKIDLLEWIGRTGSISAAGRAMKMSYRRAWELVDSMGQVFGQPVVVSQTGGRHGGGARLTPFGEQLIARYRMIERVAAQAAAPHLDALQDEMRARDAADTAPLGADATP